MIQFDEKEAMKADGTPIDKVLGECLSVEANRRVSDGTFGVRDEK